MNRTFLKAISILLTAALLMPTMWLQQIAEAAESPTGNVVLFQSFEDGQTGGWASVWGGPGTTVVSSTYASDGTRSLQFTGRTASTNSPSLDLTNLMVPGKLYDVSLKVRISEGSDTYHVASKVDSPLLQNKYPWLVGEKSVNDSDWTTFEVRNYEVPANTTELRIWLESATTSTSLADIYIDEVSVKDVTPAPSKTILSQSFEDGQTGGWGSVWGGPGTTEVSIAYASEGSRSLLFTGRTARENSPSIDLTSIMLSGKIYDLSLKVRLGEGSDTFHIGSKVDSPLLENKYPWLIGDKAVSSTEWTTFEVKGYEVPANTTELRIWVESVTSSTSLADIYIDEVLIKDVTPGTTPDDGDLDQTGILADFENGVGDWVIRSANAAESVALTDADNHTANGTQSLKVDVSTQYNGPILNVMGKMHKGHQYRLSAWVKMAPGQASTSLRISVQSGDSTFTNVSSNVAATDGQWVQLTGTFTVATTPSVLLAYVETAQTPSAPVTFYMDDFEISYIGPVAAPKPIQNLTPLKEKYEEHFLIGNAIGDAEFEGHRLELLKLHHNVVTAENAMKPDYAYNAEREFDFTAEDALIAKNEEHGLLLHGHVLVWHQQMPTWLSTAEDGSPLSRETALVNLRTHIETVVEHFGDKVISWDVVNEAMNDNPSTPSDWKSSLRNSPWKAAIGDDYVEQAYLMAREVIDENGWDIKLYYNDYNDDNQNKATAIANMVDELNESYAAANDGKLLIDGVGMQAHYNLNTKAENVEQSLKRFIDLGVEVSVTEIDITAGSDSVLSERDAKAQGYLYAQLMNIYKTYSDHIARVTFWGLNDANSWRASQNPLLFDKDLQAKPAYYGVIDPDAFIEANPPESIHANQSNAHYGKPVIDGIADSVWNSTSELPINRYQMAWQGASGVARALWDEDYLYVLIQVNNAELDKSSANAYEQDSVEVFLDQNHGQTTSYQADDGQYRVNYDNETSFNPLSISEGFESVTTITGTNYLVEMKIPLKFVTVSNETKLGFDVQINDGKAGARQSVAAWNDLTGQGYQDTSVYGVLTLKGKGSAGNADNGNVAPATGTVENKDGVITIKPLIATGNGSIKGTISDELLKRALEQASPDAEGKKQVVVELPKQGKPSTAYDLQVPTQSLMGHEEFVLLMKTEYATIHVPSNMLSNLTDLSDQVTITVSNASTESLDAATKERIGNRPILAFNVMDGTKTIAWDHSEAPVTVTIPYVPSAEELLNPDRIVVWYIDGQGVAIPVKNSRYDAATQTVVFQTTHFSNYAVAYDNRTFGDLQNVPWAKQAIDAMAARTIIKGTSENSFSPEASITRADFIALLVRALELQGIEKDSQLFSDVPEQAYYYEELSIAKQWGIVTGVGENRFNPSGLITRQDVMVLTARALEAIEKQGDASHRAGLDDFIDAATISPYARDSANNLVELGIIHGNGGRLAPKDLLSRAEAAVILYRVWDL
jgi:endo-1,4-beta-xylanase